MKRLTKTSAYKNIGDVNPLDNFGQWVKKINDNEYDIVKLNNISDEMNKEDTYQLQSALVDITDSWINKDDVNNFIGNTDNTNNMQFAIGVFDYYGAEQCGGESEILNSKQEAIDALKNEGITITE